VAKLPKLLPAAATAAELDIRSPLPARVPGSCWGRGPRPAGLGLSRCKAGDRWVAAMRSTHVHMPLMQQRCHDRSSSCSVSVRVTGFLDRVLQTANRDNMRVLQRTSWYAGTCTPPNSCSCLQLSNGHAMQLECGKNSQRLTSAAAAAMASGSNRVQPVCPGDHQHSSACGSSRRTASRCMAVCCCCGTT